MYCINVVSHKKWLVLFAIIIPLLLNTREIRADEKPELTSQEISDKISDELLFDQGVISTKIDIVTSQGIVTLSGEVNNILARDRALRIAETVKGVRAVVNKIVVKPPVLRSDSEIQKDVKAALLSNPATDSYEINARVMNGIVSLSGVVDSYQERQLVNTVTKGVRGVLDISDEIIVRYNDNRSDNEIKKEISQALLWNTLVDGLLIDVTVNDGKVSLSGTVGSAAEKRLAKSEAWVAGVNSVDTKDLSVEGWARDEKLRGDKYVIKPAAELKNAIKSALLYDPRVLSTNVDVNVVESTATLRGTVDNLAAKRAAENDARNTVGVTYVNNRLKVRFDTPRLDSNIAQDIQAAFLRDPYVERFDITVNVWNETAYLYGRVDSQFEKNRAEELASDVNGVTDVNNYLSVDSYEPYVYDPYVDDNFVDHNVIREYERRALYRTDSQIKSSIQSELWWSPFVSSDQVQVSVDNGIATLSGTVNSWSERSAATENAYEGGALLVRNEMLVNYDTE